MAGWVGGMEQELHKQSPSSAQRIPGWLLILTRGFWGVTKIGLSPMSL